MLVLAPVWLIAVTTTIAIAIGLVVGFCIGYVETEGFNEPRRGSVESEDHE